MSDTICRSCRRGISTETTVCPHCGSTAPLAPLNVYNDHRSRGERAVIPAFAMLLLVLGVWLVVAMAKSTPAPKTNAEYGPVLPPNDDADLTQPGPFTLRSGQLVCTTPDALDRGIRLLGEGDTQAYAAYVADASNGCGVSSTRVRVYATRERHGIQRIHKVGSPDFAYVVNGALAK